MKTLRYALPLLVILYLSCKDEEPEIHPTRQDITVSVYTSVTVQPDSMYQVQAAVNGILQQNLKEEGDLVSTGTPLVHIRDESPELNTQNARLQYQLAEINYTGESSPLKELESQIETASLTYRNDSVNYYRQKRLWEQQIGSKSQFETRLLAYERSRNQLLTLQNQFDRLKTELEIKRSQAANTFRATQVNTDEFTVRSTINGKVYALYKEPGEHIVPNEPLALLGSPDRFVIQMLVDEVDIVRIKTGQEAIISLDAYEEEVFEAKVTKIYPQKDERTQTFRVEALFKDQPDVLYPGLSGEGSIIVSQKKDVLTIPKIYLSGPHTVRTREGEMQVKTGLETLDYIEILEGLDEQTVLVKPDE